MRFITAGVLPPLLARHGLPAALQTYAGQSPQRPVIHAQDGVERPIRNVGRDGRLCVRHRIGREPASGSVDRISATGGGCAFP